MADLNYTSNNALSFINFLSFLAPEGETLLLVQQKMKRDGSQVWIPYLPKNYDPQAQGAWYANTGSFITDRFDNGKPKASKSCATHVLCMVLDDVGTKSKIPPLAPTWVIETSPDNYQYGYVFSTEDAPNTEEFSSAIVAIANAGYTDGGAVNAVRNFRIPNSINLKKGRNNFASRLVEFNPEREFTLAQICTAFEVDPAEPDTVRRIPIQLKDDGGDDILYWLSDNQLLLDTGNREGWYGVVCPNALEHSDANPMGRYHPVHRSFACFHEHCTHVDSNQFLAWAHAQGAPLRQAGLRDDLLTSRYADALKKITPKGDFTYPTERVERVRQKQQNRMDKEEWYTRYAFMTNNGGFHDLIENTFIPRPSFNALYAHIQCRSVHTGSVIPASICFDQNRESHNAIVASEYTYASGDAPILSDAEGVVRINRWRDGRPQVEPNPHADVSLWLDLMERLIPEEVEREHVLNVMAYKVQNPKEKINHAILHMGTEGCGKDTLWSPFIWAVCGENQKNLGLMNCDSMLSQFTNSLESEILILNELKEPDIMGRRALANKMKEWIAAPPDLLEINRKGENRYYVANRLFVLAFSNEETPISLSSRDRRWYPIESRIARLPAEKAVQIWKWYKNGGFEAIASMLHARDVSKFNPRAVPTATQAKETLIENGRTELEELLVGMIKDREGVFSHGVLATPLVRVLDILRYTLPRTSQMLHKNSLISALHESGWVSVPKCHSREQQSLKNLMVAPEYAKASKSELANLWAEVEPVLDIANTAKSQSVLKLIK